MAGIQELSWDEILWWFQEAGELLEEDRQAQEAALSE